MRTNLKVLRVKMNLSQEEIAEKLGCTRATYAAVENGQRSGTLKFWETVKETFDVPEIEMWSLMKSE